MDWTDCPVIEAVPGRMSGAPVLRGSRVRPQDILANAGRGAGWIADAYGLPLDDVRAVLLFHARHEGELPLEHIPPEQAAALGVDGIDWSGCPLVERTPARLGGAAVIRHTPVRAVDLLANRAEGESGLARRYGLPVGTVRAVLRFYDQHRQLAPAA